MRAEDDRKALEKERSAGRKRPSVTPWVTPGATKGVRHDFGRPVKRLYTPLDLQGKTEEDARKAGHFPYNARHPSDDVPRRLVDERMFAGMECGGYKRLSSI